LETERLFGTGGHGICGEQGSRRLKDATMVELEGLTAITRQDGDGDTRPA
jgi:hypothetical protein